MIRVRSFRPDDRAFVLGLAARLTIGMPPWRDPAACLRAVEGWIAFSCVWFFRAVRGKTIHKRIGKHHAAAG